MPVLCQLYPDLGGGGSRGDPGRNSLDPGSLLYL